MVDNKVNFSLIEDIFRERRLITKEQGFNIARALLEALSVPGDVVEMGAYLGHTCAIMQIVLDNCVSSRRLLAFKSFQGLPSATSGDIGQVFQKGILSCSKEDFFKTFKHFGVREPVLCEGLFENTVPHRLPNNICFAHIDCDLYAATLHCLTHIYPRLSRGGIVFVDDYYDPLDLPYDLRWSEAQLKSKHCPGVKRACDDFFSDKIEKMQMVPAGEGMHGCFVKQKIGGI